jgi:23S rRNA (adenine2503-C2)-methyltransferase
MSKIVLTGLLPQEITSLLDLKQSFRGKQIFKWIGNGVSDFDKMTNLSLELREDLKEKLPILSQFRALFITEPKRAVKYKSPIDKTIIIL